MKRNKWFVTVGHASGEWYVRNAVGFIAASFWNRDAADSCAFVLNS